MLKTASNRAGWVAIGGHALTLKRLKRIGGEGQGILREWQFLGGDA